MIEKVTLTEALKSFQSGNVGNVISVSGTQGVQSSKEQLSNGVGITHYKQAKLTNGQEVDLGYLPHGLYIVRSVSASYCGLYVLGAYLPAYYPNPATDNNRFGDFSGSYEGKEVQFGRKEVSGDVYLKSNRANSDADIEVVGLSVYL